MANNERPTAQANILVVDDTPANLQVLAGMLKAQGYKVRPVPSGELALQAAEIDPPNLILLDIMMPDMDGFEVCRRLKEGDRFREIPVIFISALSETADKVKAFQTGGVDYVTKPFQTEEVLARVKTHLDLRCQGIQLKEAYEGLRELEVLRDALVHMMAHDMRSPLQVISGFLSFLEGDLLESEVRDQLPAKTLYYLRKTKTSADSLIEMVSSMLDVSKMEAGEMSLELSECDLWVIAGKVAGDLEALRGSRELTVQAPEQPATIRGDETLLARTLQNLVNNALKFAPSTGGRVHMGIEPAATGVRVFVQDNGPGIPPEHQPKVFDKFWQAQARETGQKYSTGLGLTFCKLAVEAHGGRIGVESEVGRGSTFWFELPQTGPEAHGRPDASGAGARFPAQGQGAAASKLS